MRDPVQFISYYWSTRLAYVFQEFLQVLFRCVQYLLAVHFSQDPEVFKHIEHVAGVDGSHARDFVNRYLLLLQLTLAHAIA